MAEFENTRIEKPRDLPSVDRLLQVPAMVQLEESLGRVVVRERVREALDWARGALAKEAIFTEVIVERVASGIQREISRELVGVINATGVILHTNLGRAPLAAHVLDRVREIAQGFANLELDLHSGKRGQRGGAVEALLCSITGAEAALCVNNNAAAVLLALASICQKGEAVVSRGELVEIGGSFRMPDVMALSGTSLVEVGTTNRTRSEDYAQAISPETKALVRVHRGNFHQGGFVENPSFSSVQALASDRNIPLLVDLGHGALCDLPIPEGDGLPRTVQGCLSAGADLVMASTDKLIGGPQAGILVGRKALVEQARGHALHRAVRADKLTLAALEAVLLDHARGRLDEIPVLQMIQAPEAEVAARAGVVLEVCAGPLDEAGFVVDQVPCTSTVGGGSDPRFSVPSVGIELSHTSASVEDCAAWLRSQTPPVLGRIHDERILLDLRTITDTQATQLGEALCALARKTRTSG